MERSDNRVGTSMKRMIVILLFAFAMPAIGAEHVVPAEIYSPEDLLEPGPINLPTGASESAAILEATRRPSVLLRLIVCCGMFDGISAQMLERTPGGYRVVIRDTFERPSRCAAPLSDPQASRLVSIWRHMLNTASWSHVRAVHAPDAEWIYASATLAGKTRWAVVSVAPKGGRVEAFLGLTQSIEAYCRKQNTATRAAVDRDSAALLTRLESKP